MKKIANNFVVALLLLIFSCTAWAARSYSVTSECEYVKATCQGNTTYIEIDKDMLKKLMPSLAPCIKKTNGKYKIRGDKSYKTLTVGIMGQDVFPFIVLLRADGVIEFVDVNTCLQRGKFNVTARTAKFKDVIAFENALCHDGETGYNTILAIRKNGARTDLEGTLYSK